MICPYPMSRYEFSTEIKSKRKTLESGKYNVAFGFNSFPNYYFITAWKEGNNNINEPDYAEQGSKSAIVDSPFGPAIEDKYPDKYMLCILDLPF
jgi:hypothetical protein|tara:strand:+ start:233 stop:514 length:282 start_codon:yes stop_codon:yes gene_type:complete